MLCAQQRLPSAMIAAGLGVFSSQTHGRSLFGDLRHDRPRRSAATATPGSCGRPSSARTRETRLAAIRKLLATGKDGLQKEAARALVARAATLVEPDTKLAKDAPELISAMLAGGYDQAAARWIPAVNGMDDADSDRCWAMLALGGTQRRRCRHEPDQQLHSPRQ